MARKKTFTQDEVYEATHQLMLAEGYDQFNFMKLAKALDVSRTALYKYYSNKDDLLHEFLNAQMNECVQRIETTDWSENYEDKLSQLLDLIFDFADVHSISIQVPNQKWTEANQHQSNIQESKQLHEKFFNFIKDVIIEGQRNGVLNAQLPPFLLIETIFHSLMLPNRTGLSAQKRSDFMKVILFNGILNSNKENN